MEVDPRICSGNARSPVQFDDDGRRFERGFVSKKSGSDLLSQEVYLQVPSAQAGLTAVFEMGTGVSPPLWPPEICCQGDVPEYFRASASCQLSPRPISTGRLRVLPLFHLRPINVMVSSRALLR